MKGIMEKGLLFIPFVLIYIVLYIFNIVYNINIVFTVYSVFMWLLFLIYVIYRKKAGYDKGYFTILIFSVVLLLHIINIIRRI